MIPLRLFLDQNLRVETKEFLIGLGCDVVSARDLGMSRSSDEEIAAAARRENRIVMTFNGDFSDVRALDPGHPGVIRLRIEPQIIEVVHPVLARFFEQVAWERLAGALTTVTNARVRIRRPSTL